MKKVKLGEVATFINGYAFKPQDWSSEGKEIIRIQNLTKTSKEINYYSGTIDKKYIIEDGDILISWSGTLGVFQWCGKSAVLNQHIFKVVFDKIDIDKSYFKYVVEKGLQDAVKHTHGSTMKHLTKKYFDNILVSYTNLREQQRIASELDLLSKLILRRQEQLKELNLLVKSRFNEMFGSKKFDKVSISELVDDRIETAKKIFDQHDTIKYIDISSIDNKNYKMTGFQEYMLNQAPSRAQQHIRKGDIVVSTVRPNLKNIAITELDDENLVAPSGFCVLRALKCLPEYLFAIICSDRFTNKMTNIVTGANYPAIKSSDIMNYIVSLPPIQLQNEFADFVAQVDKSQLAIQKSLEELETLKKSLMQEYFG